MPQKTKIISIINHKGGVGKTTSTVNIATALAQKGKKVLVVDLDTQMNLTHSLIGDLPEDEQNITESILSNDIPITEVIKPTHIKNLDIAPSGESMVDMDLKLHSALSRELRLKTSLKKVVRKYDFIFIDNPPHVSLTTINSLSASNYFLVPVSAEYLPLVGIKHLLKTIDNVKNINKSLKNLGYLITMVDKRASISSSVENLLRKHFNKEVFKSTIRVNTKLKTCPQFQKTIFEVEGKNGKSSSDYNNVSSEILERMGK